MISHVAVFTMLFRSKTLVCPSSDAVSKSEPSLRYNKTLSKLIQKSKIGENSLRNGHVQHCGGVAGAVRADVAPANVHDPHETLERRRQHQVAAPAEPGETRDPAADSYGVPRNLCNGKTRKTLVNYKLRARATVI